MLCVCEHIRLELVPIRAVVNLMFAPILQSHGINN
jgi:hypothetical protein